MSGECSAAPAPGHAGHLATFPAGLTEPRTGRMPHRQPRDRHPQMHHRQTGRRSLHARGTPANVRRSRSCRRFARRHSSSTPRLHRRNRSAFRARGAPTRYVHRAIPGPVPPGSLRASLSHPPVRASHQPRMPFHQRYPVFRMDARSRRLARPVDVENEVSRYSGGTGQKFCAEVLTTTRAES